MSRLSIVGLYEYDSTIFEDLIPPTGVQKQDVIDYILLECADLELLYPSLNMMKIAIRAWSIREHETWQKLQDTITAEYNPLWNVDATILETGSSSRERGGSENSSRERDGSGSNSGTNTNSVKGYNSANWSDNEKDASSNSQTWSEDDTNSQTWSEDDSEQDTRTTRRTGNIGVTSSQDLIKQEREVAMFNIIDYIVGSFKKRFCLLIY